MGTQCLYAITTLGWALCVLGFQYENRPCENESAQDRTLAISGYLFGGDEGAICGERTIPQITIAPKNATVSALPAAASSPLLSNASSPLPELPSNHDSGHSETSDGNVAPVAFKLYQNSPNPFHAQSGGGVTLIRFDLPETQTGAMDLAIYDLMGQPVRHLFNGEQAPGPHAITWDGKDDAGNPVPPGRYWYRIKIDKRMFSKMLNVVR